MNPTIQELVDKADESLRIAKVIAKEKSFGFAVSRAYYAMFYATEALLLLKNISLSKHSAVIAAFGREYVKSGDLDAKYHQYLLNAFDLRQVGDYESLQKIDKGTCLKAISYAREFIKATKEIVVSDVNFRQG